MDEMIFVASDLLRLILVNVLVSLWIGAKLFSNLESLCYIWIFQKKKTPQAVYDQKFSNIDKEKQKSKKKKTDKVKSSEHFTQFFWNLFTFS